MIEESDLGYLLHFIFQNQGIEPGVLMGLRDRNDRISDGERAFILASTKKAITDGDVPIKLRNFSSNKDKKKGG